LIALGIIVLILLIVLLLPVGADAGYIGGVLSLKVKAGPFSIGILPSKKTKDGRKKEKKPKKPKKEKKKTAAEDVKDKKSKKQKQKLSFEDIMGIVRLALKTLGRFRRSLSVDRLMIHVVASGSDPYAAVMNYGYVNAAIGALLPLIHRCFKVKTEDYDSGIDFEAEKLKIDAQIVLSLRIGEILLIVLCAAWGFLRWMRGRKRRAKAEKAKNTEKITEDTSAEKGI